MEMETAIMKMGKEHKAIIKMVLSKMSLKLAMTVMKMKTEQKEAGEAKRRKNKKHHR